MEPKVYSELVTLFACRVCGKQIFRVYKSMELMQYQIDGGIKSAWEYHLKESPCCKTGIDNRYNLK